MARLTTYPLTEPNTVYKAYQRWFRSNKLIALFTLLIKESDLEWVFIDGTHIKAHQHSCGSNEVTQAISKSVAGRATKIHLAVERIVADGWVSNPPL